MLSELKAREAAKKIGDIKAEAHGSELEIPSCVSDASTKVSHSEGSLLP